jgi:hypothetical protein
MAEWRAVCPQNDFPPSVDGKYKELEDKVPHAGYTFMGLISLIDPPKIGVPESVSAITEPACLAACLITRGECQRKDDQLIVIGLTHGAVEG